MSGIKHDSGKPQLSYISRELLEAMAQVRAFGAKKYARDNWKQGFKYNRTIDALLRHIFAFLSGEDNDPESGLNHIYHAACNIEHLIYDIKHHPENDDRTKSLTLGIDASKFMNNEEYLDTMAQLEMETRLNDLSRLNGHPDWCCGGCDGPSDGASDDGSTPSSCGAV